MPDEDFSSLLVIYLILLPESSDKFNPIKIMIPNDLEAFGVVSVSNSSMDLRVVDEY